MKYELVETDTKQFAGRTLYRIKALVDIGLIVTSGDLGGYIESEKNLSQMSGKAWVHGDAQVSGNAQVQKSIDHLQIGPAKSSGRFTTAFIDSTIGVRVVCGCFTGSVLDFSQQIEKTHAYNKEALEQYRLFCQLIAFNFGATT